MTLFKRANLSGSSSPPQPVTGRLSALLETKKNDSRLLGALQEHALTNSSVHTTDFLHPSEISHDDWCRRAGYYRLKGVKPRIEAQPLHWRMAMMFDEGHEIHRVQQNRIWDIGRLTGEFYCLRCEMIWWDTAPNHCGFCDANRRFLQYREVPLLHMGMRLAGHADGIDGDNEALIEIKSIGLGTLRYEAPELLRQHTYNLNINGRNREFIDYDGLWDSIRRPFPSHIRQAHIYSFLGAPVDEIFLYQCKWNQKMKEFVVKFREERISHLLEDCREIRRGWLRNEPPSCRQGGCPECQMYEETIDRPGRPRYVLTRHQKDLPAETAPDGGGVQGSIWKSRRSSEGVPGTGRNGTSGS